MHFLSYVASAISGLVLCGIGFIGLTDMPAQPVDQLTILLEPTDYGSRFDTAYLAAISLAGGWLILYFQARIAAATAMILILFKIVIQHGVTALALTIVLCALIATSVVLRVRETN